MAEQHQDENGDEKAADTLHAQSGPDREEMASNYLPETNNWSAKTFLDTRDPAAIAALRQLGEMYPEVEELQRFVDEVVDEFMQAQTSVGGQSRREYKAILQSMYGSNPDEKGQGDVIMQALGADDED